jgi:hypothetical protein
MFSDRLSFSGSALAVLLCACIAWQLPDLLSFRAEINPILEHPTEVPLVFTPRPASASMSFEVVDAESQLPVNAITVIGGYEPLPHGQSSQYWASKLQLVCNQQSAQPVLTRVPPWTAESVDLRGGDPIWVCAPGYIAERAQLPYYRKGLASLRVELHKGGSLELMLPGHNPFFRTRMRLSDAAPTSSETIVDSIVSGERVIFDALPAGSYKLKLELETLREPLLLAECRIELVVGQLTRKTIHLKPVPSSVFDPGEGLARPDVPTEPGELCVWLQINGPHPAQTNLGLRKARLVAPTSKDGLMSLELPVGGLSPGRYQARLIPSTFEYMLELDSASGESEIRTIPERLACLALGLGDRPLRASVLTLTQGITGSIHPAPRTCIASLSYDWNQGRFRAYSAGIRSTSDGRGEWQERQCELREEEFRRILDGVRDLGLGSLPLESPAEIEDIYSRDLGIQFLHGDVNWSNGAPGGCLRGHSSVQPTDEERERFDAVVAFIEQSLAALDPQPVLAADHCAATIEEPWVAAAFGRLAEQLRRGPLSDRLDYNHVHIPKGRPQAAPIEFHWAFDGGQHAKYERLPMGSDYYRIRMGLEDPEIVVTNGDWNISPSAADRERRASFVAANPELSASQRELIQQGLISIGMTQAMIQAAWGQPKGQRSSADANIPNEWASFAGGHGLVFVDGKLDHVLARARN